MNFKKTYIKLLILILLAITLIVGCSKKEVSQNTAQASDSEKIQSESPVNTAATTTITPESTVVPEVTITPETPQPSAELVVEEEIYISQKNTNGNLNNSGVVAPDRSTMSHLVSVGSNVYKFDPVLRTSEILFSLDGGGRATYINATEEWVYYINSSDNWVYRVNRNDYSQTEAIIQQKCVYLSEDQGRFFHTIEEEGSTSFYYWNEDSGNIITVKRGSLYASHLYSRVYYYKNSISSGNQIAMCATSGAGNLTLQYLEGVLDTVKEMFAYESDKLLVVGELDGKTLLYHYIDDSFNKIENADPLPSNIRNINSDYTHFYFIGGDGGNSSIYRMDKETFETEKLLEVSDKSTHLNVLNNWIYYGDADSTNLYKYKIGEAEASIIE